MADTVSKFHKTPIEYLKGVGPKRGELLQQELEIFTVWDLLHHFPYRYIDRTKIYNIAEVQPGNNAVQVKGRLTNITTAGNKQNKRMVAQLKDETATMELVWFQGLKWISKYLQPNVDYIAFGKPTVFNRKLNMVHPEMEPVTGSNKEENRTMEPVYSTTEKLKGKGLDSKGILKLVANAINLCSEDDFPENLPSSVIDRYRFPAKWQALQQIHFPQTSKQAQRAEGRMKFEELFFIQLPLIARKMGREQTVEGFRFPELGERFHNFYYKNLPFSLTGAQKRVMREVRQDVDSGKQMNRLLQGDVGSGKTIVALMTMLMAIDNGFQASMMAPTEILAQQHYQTLQQLTEGLGIRVQLLTGSIKGKDRQDILKLLQNGEINILVGTHALIEEKVQYDNLGVVVVDEQHRFGVAQRAKLWQKNHKPPHVLVMTATPIPRTLAMTTYGDLDASVIDELPPGRKPIKTVHRTDAHRIKVFGFLEQEINKGNQAYIVYPLIEESVSLNYKYLDDGYESVLRAFPQLGPGKIGILHGRMGAEEREQEMGKFARGETKIMVATTVIEVGVDVPNANVMVIESAERFGLSQLHQLRGRVGRGSEQAYCILMSAKELGNDARKRLQTMTQTNDGFEIAEADMKLRGPGDLEGTRQSGVASLRLANLSQDGKILQEARTTAEKILTEDFTLDKAENKVLKTFIQDTEAGKIRWDKIS